MLYQNFIFLLYTRFWINWRLKCSNLCTRSWVVNLKKLFLTKNLISARCGIWRCRCCRRLQIITLVSLVLVIEKPQTVNSFRESGLEGRQVKFDRNRQVPFVVDRMNEAQMFEENRPLNSTPTEADQENTKNHYLILHC